MGTFNFNDAEKYGGQGGGGYFSLKNHGDVGRVRFLYNGIDDVEGYAVHQVEIDGRKRYVNCKRAYNEPIDNCPFCRERIPQQARLFIPLYDVDEDKVKIWERGKKFFAKISSLCARYANENPLVSQVFEIERNGEAGSTQTTYEVYAVGSADKTTIEDLPEFEGVLGGAVLDKSVDDMEYFLENGQFPPEEGSAPVRRRDSAPVRRRADAPARRTPAGTRDNVPF